MFYQIPTILFFDFVRRQEGQFIFRYLKILIVTCIFMWYIFTLYLHSASS